MEVPIQPMQAQPNKLHRGFGATKTKQPSVSRHEHVVKVDVGWGHGVDHRIEQSLPTTLYQSGMALNNRQDRTDAK